MDRASNGQFTVHGAVRDQVVVMEVGCVLKTELHGVGAMN